MPWDSETKINRSDLSASSRWDLVVPFRLVAVARHAAVTVARSRMIVFPLNFSILSLWLDQSVP